MRGFGFTQSEVDRRCFIFTDPISGGTIIICIHVDDSFIWCSDEVLWRRFFAAWSERFPPSEEGLKGALAAIAAEATQLEFCGLTFTINDEGSFEVSAGKLVRDLEAKLAVHGAPAGDFTTPMAADAIQALRAPPTETDCVLFDPALVESAMSIVGLGGWIVQACRADALLPFIALSQQLVVNFKKSTWRAVLRWGHYLVATAASKVMTFRPPPLGGCDWLASADSSCINALDEEGQLGPSFAAWTLHFPGSAPFDAGCVVLRGLGHATAHSELRIMVYVAKIAFALRMIAVEMGFPPSRATCLLGDSKAAFEGSLLDKMRRQERFLAAQRAMLRLWVRSGVFHFVRVPGSALRPDINTKSNFTRREFDYLSRWVQSGVPCADDQLRLDAMARFESGGDSVAHVAHVGEADGNGVERVDPVRLGNSQVDGGSASGSVADEKPEREVIQLLRQVRKQAKTIRRSEDRIAELMAALKESESRDAGRVRCAARKMQELVADAEVVEKCQREQLRDAQHRISTLSGMVKAAKKKSAGWR